jgi:hypothetical protein
MCDYSLELIMSRPAKAGDKLVSTSFPKTPTRGFASADDRSVLGLGIDLARLVHKIEYGRRGPEPFSTIFKRPNAIGFRKLSYKCLNEWIGRFGGLGSASLGCIHES